MTIQIISGLTFQQAGVAINVNFVLDDSVYVSRHEKITDNPLPHNCTGLTVYDFSNFERLAEIAIADGASVFSAIGDQDLPLPTDFI
jgi:hypothetical protein